MKFSPKQAQGLSKIAAWMTDPHGKPTFYLAGLAGSGKSTLVEHIVRDLKGRICYMAPTGKAANVMRGKGCPEASTVHRTIYRPAGDPMSKAQIEQLRTSRRVQRTRRARHNLPVISIVGYTNAGKSTLFNALTGAQVHAENQLFATLDPTTRLFLT